MGPSVSKLETAEIYLLLIITQYLEYPRPIIFIVRHMRTQKNITIGI